MKLIKYLYDVLITKDMLDDGIYTFELFSQK